MHPKIQRPKPCVLMFASLVALDSFHLLLCTQLTANLTPEWSGGSMFHPLSHIYAKTPFCCIDALNCRYTVVFDQLWTNVAPTLNAAFLLTNVLTKWWIHCHTDIFNSSAISTSIYDWPKWVCGVFWWFTSQVANLDDLSIQHHLYLYDHI